MPLLFAYGINRFSYNVAHIALYKFKVVFYNSNTAILMIKVILTLACVRFLTGRYMCCSVPPGPGHMTVPLTGPAGLAPGVSLSGPKVGDLRV